MRLVVKEVDTLPLLSCLEYHTTLLNLLCTFNEFRVLMTDIGLGRTRKRKRKDFVYTVKDMTLDSYLK